MKATELIDKKAIRTKCANLAGGMVDRSLLDRPIKIIKATDSHIVYKDVKGYGFGMNDDWYEKLQILSYEYCDNNWTDFDKLMEGTEEVQEKSETA
jgi:hypothetical protein